VTDAKEDVRPAEQEEEFASNKRILRWRASMSSFWVSDRPRWDWAASIWPMPWS
jgi:hypothetical protein